MKMGSIEKNLKEKVEKIIITHKKLKEENDVLRKRNTSLENEIQVNTVKIKELTNKYNSLKIAQSVELSEEEKGDALKKVNNLVREINKCIALLNT